ncbi:MAG: O-methyltransferase [Anaerolineae bacterium]
MTQTQWTAVDDYFAEALIPEDEILTGTLRLSEVAGLPAHNVAPNQGKLLMLLALSIGAKSILEIGTLGGYSTIWLARALPDDGRLITLEADPDHAEVARQNITTAGLIDRVAIHIGLALDTLATMANSDPFDLIFIDADKENNVGYFEWALQLSHPGSLIIVDNVVRGGAVIDANSDDSRVQGVRRFVERATSEPRVIATALQTVGSKGYDGFVIMRVKQ